MIISLYDTLVTRCIPAGFLAVMAGVAIGWYAKKTASLDDEPSINASALVDFQLLFTL